MGDWRSHAGGLNRLIEMRGGVHEVLKQSPYLSPTISIFVLYVLRIPKTCHRRLINTQHRNHGKHMLPLLGPTRNHFLPH
jgi:hypothetical protein